MRRIIHIILPLFLSIGVQSQEEIGRLDRQLLQYQHIKDLKGGSMVVALQSKSKKIAALQKLIKHPSTKNKVKTRSTKLLNETIKSRDDFNKELIKAFERHFSFAELYFMYDSAVHQLKSGLHGSFFLDTALQIKPALELPDSNFYIFLRGNLNYEDYNGVEAYMLKDQKFKSLEKPFPFYVTLDVASTTFAQARRKTEGNAAITEYIVQKLQKNLDRFWIKSDYKIARIQRKKAKKEAKRKLKEIQ